ncbi:MAG: hypothetical protein A4S12_05530 [Proteobacteria bacterium SG_bin5]|nr:Crp/Fnr family transcriptional regulator [Sphingomonas sp.]OQW43177.1 MAG: hypothetical protein A4S12_05530 [Proteobacteria bacterium SG_bin5]
MPQAATLPSRCTDCSGRDQALCAQLSPEALSDFAGLGRVRRLEPGTTLSWEGERVATIGTVRAGLLKLSASLADGRELIVGLAGPGDLVGDPRGAPASHSVTALGEASLCLVPRDAFTAFIAREGAAARVLLERLFGELDKARRWLLLIGAKTAGERVASLLLDLADRAAVAEGAPIDLPLTRQQMAGLLGLTIETVSRRLHAFAGEGVIALPDLRHFVLLDRARLAMLAGA